MPVPVPGIGEGIPEGEDVGDGMPPLGEPEPPLEGLGAPGVPPPPELVLQPEIIREAPSSDARIAAGVAALARVKGRLSWRGAFVGSRLGMRRAFSRLTLGEEST